MNKKLDLDDAYCWEFVSKVADVKKIDDNYEIILEATAFYPESGGQLYDTGLLDEQKVVNVFKNEDEDVVHVTEQWKADVGSIVSGSIDADRRLENMRKHTGQHILSSAFIEIAGANTVSAHLGETESRIELSKEALEDDLIYKTEQLANNIILENLPVRTHYMSREEMDKYPIRKIPEREGKFRIIEVDKFDFTACGGTHCKTTGEIGLVKIVGQEKLRNHLRITFLAGQQALKDYYDKHNTVTQLTNKLTCHFTNLNSSVDKLLEQNTSCRKEIAMLNKKLLPLEIDQLEKSSEVIGDFKLIAKKYDNKESGEIREIALAVCRKIRAVAILLSGDKLQISVSKDVNVEASKLAGLIMEKYGGKGGGSSVFAQIGSIPLEKTELIIDNISGLINNQSDG